MTAATFGLLAALLVSAPPAPPGKVGVVRTDEATHFYVDGELVTSYHHGPKVAKPYFWPLNAPGNVPLTRAWPLEKGQPGETTDHVHQKSAWFCYGDVVPEGVETQSKIKGVKGVDFWTEQPTHGVIACSKVSVMENTPGRAEARTANVWKTASGQAILDEDRRIELFNLGHARLLIVSITLKSAAVPVTFADTKEGAFGVRVSDRLRVGDAKAGNPKSSIINAAGKNGEKDCWGQRADWCDYSGVIDGKPFGIAIFEDTANKPRSCWHVRNYGLMAANPFGRWEHANFPAMKDKNEPLVRLKVGDQLTLRYGILLHEGDTESGRVADAYRKFLALLQ